MIPFNTPPYVGVEQEYVLSAINENRLCGDGKFNRLCQEWFEKQNNCTKALLTPSCTSALELAALLIDIQVGDEVIMPSYTFVSTANAFVLRGAKIVFVDIRPDTMNIDETKIEVAITDKTKAIVPVHYAGIACEMDTIMAIAKKHGLFVIEDAAQAVMSFYKNKALGTIGHLGCYSFHETKNYTSGGEGGALLINGQQFVERAEIIREKGTNRSQFLKGQVDKYTWRDIGSSFLPSEIQAAYLYGQLINADLINNRRIAIWQQYHQSFELLERDNLLERPYLPSSCDFNAHIYYLKLKSETLRTSFMKKMSEAGIQTTFHYVPLHTSPAGLKYGRFHGKDKHTTDISRRLVRLPLWYNLDDRKLRLIIEQTVSFFDLNQWDA